MKAVPWARLRSMLPPVALVVAITAWTGPSWVSVIVLGLIVLGDVVLLALAEETNKTLTAKLSEARASEHMVRGAAERALGNCVTVRPEVTLTGDTVLHVIPTGTAVEVQDGVEVWHVHIGQEDVSKVGRP